jgi:hypothetical protein
VGQWYGSGGSIHSHKEFSMKKTERRLCNSCQKPIAAQRLQVLPDTNSCASCSTVERVVGFMAWPHKTGSYLEIVPAGNSEALRKAIRANRRAR